ncbi:MAG: glycosyltransferase family 39 protein [Porphyromonas sp.]|nr:glycosyltransferase family 39 protein [Porphyromonas sp.]
MMKSRRRTSRFLRYLHSQKAILSLLFIVVVSVLLGIFGAEFYTKGEPREAIVAQAMLDSGDFVLPRVYGAEFAYKPPMSHWLMIVASALTGGEITEVSGRLPSAIAFIILVMASFYFYLNRVRYRTAFLVPFVLLTTFEVHRAGITARVDMLLTLFIVLTLFALYRWEEKRGLKGIPITVPLLITMGILTKGPVALVLPIFIFGLYLLLLKEYGIGDIIKKLLIVSLLSIPLPAIWYYLAWQEGGDAFLSLAFAENFMRFFHVQPEALHYALGHEKPAYFVLIFLLSGALPWTLQLFFIPWKKDHPDLLNNSNYREVQINNARWERLNGVSKVRFFSILVVVVTLIFYMLPSSKRSVYLLPLFPFLSLLIAESLLHMVQITPKRLVAFSKFVSGIALITVVALFVLQYSSTTFGMSDPKMLHTLEVVRYGIHAYPALSLLLTSSLLIMILTTVYQIKRKGYIKIVYCIVFIFFFLNLNIDGPVMMGFKEQHSAKRFAQMVTPIVEKSKAEVYTISRLREGIKNLYGLAFYTHIQPLAFDREKPNEGFLILWEKNIDEIRERFLGGYNVQVIAKDTAPIQEGGIAVLLWFEKE